MKIERTNREDAVILKPLDKINSNTAEELNEAIKEVLSEGTDTLALDLSEVDYISSMGLRVLVGTYKEMQGKTFKLISPNDVVMEVLRLAGLLNIFTIEK